MPIAECQVAELKRAYQTLGIPFSASALSIKQAYRRIAKRWHADLYPTGTPAYDEATQMMNRINEAYSLIQHAPLRYHVERRVAHSCPRYESVGAPPFAFFEGWATILPVPTRCRVFGQSFSFTAPASAPAYHRKLLQAHSSGALTNRRATGLRCI